MSIAEIKKSQNVIEYLLYMWNMEQLHRALGFEESAIVEYIKKSLKEDEFEVEKAFHKKLSIQMKKEGILASGHLSELEEIMVELHYLHGTLLGVLKDTEYETAFKSVEGLLNEFKEKTDGKTRNDIEAMLTAIFGFLTLKMNQKEVSDATTDAITSFSKVLALLASKYKLMKQGHLNFNLN